MADPNRALFEFVVKLLGPVLDDLVFVGGCTTGIFLTDAAAGGIRPTKDVDAIVDVTSYAQYSALSDRLRKLGLVEDTSEGAPLCRWRQGNIFVDVMPTEASVLGFSNRWYPSAIDSAQRFDIAGCRVRIVTPALFIATKLEAFHGRGKNDVFSSHDLEDIVTVVDGRLEIVDDVAAANEQIRAFIATEIRSLLDNADFVEALPGAPSARCREPSSSEHRRRALESPLAICIIVKGATRRFRADARDYFKIPFGTVHS